VAVEEPGSAVRGTAARGVPVLTVSQPEGHDVTPSILADVLAGFVVVGLFALVLIVWDGVRWCLKNKGK